MSGLHSWPDGLNLGPSLIQAFDQILALSLGLGLGLSLSLGILRGVWVALHMLGGLQLVHCRGLVIPQAGRESLCGLQKSVSFIPSAHQ